MIVIDKTIEPLLANPFFILGVSPDATRQEIEREAQKLLGMLELGFAEAKTYATPLGPRERTPDLVRSAVAALREPYQRRLAELWARHAPPARTEATVVATAPESGAGAGTGAGAGLRTRLGWSR